MSRSRIFYTALLALVILLFYGGFVLLWLLGAHDLSRDLATFWGVDLGLMNGPGHPSVPFFDLYGTLSWRDCYLKGHYVMAANPCDPLGRALMRPWRCRPKHRPPGRTMPSPNDRF